MLDSSKQLKRKQASRVAQNYITGMRAARENKAEIAGDSSPPAGRGSAGKGRAFVHSVLGAGTQQRRQKGKAAGTADLDEIEENVHMCMPPESPPVKIAYFSQRK